MVRGRIVQEFDVKRQKPEVVRAEKIFIGGGPPRDFVIYHAKEEYKHVLETREAVSKGLMIAPCGDGTSSYKLGQTFDTLVLMPVRAADRRFAEGGWALPFWGVNVSQGRALDMLLREAKGMGRLQARPPKTGIDACMECAPPNVR